MSESEHTTILIDEFPMTEEVYAYALQRLAASPLHLLRKKQQLEKQLKEEKKK